MNSVIQMTLISVLKKLDRVLDLGIQLLETKVEEEDKSREL